MKLTLSPGVCFFERPAPVEGGFWGQPDLFSAMFLSHTFFLIMLLPVNKYVQSYRAKSLLLKDATS